MKKIGICTFYYRNRNYGANLQAYALQKIVESFGVQAEMISYTSRTRLYGFLADLKHSIKKNNSLSNEIASRITSIDQFNMAIPHSKLYYSDTIKKANAGYDGFIVGSDQVWNPEWINNCMSLAFVTPEKRTIAYAASTGKIKLDDVQRSKLRVALENTDYISIREKESIPVLQELTDKRIQHTLDPTLLLNQTQWNEICAKRLLDEDYMFCYFLGNNEHLRTIARQYAEKRHLKLVAFPYLNGTYRSVDDGFGDCQLFNIAPAGFLSLIKHASFVMTDSFHGSVFCHIFGTEFAVSGGGKDEMGCRMISLTKLFGTENRYIREHDDVTVDALIAMENKPMELETEKYESMRQKSLAFLKEALDNE